MIIDIKTNKIKYLTLKERSIDLLEISSYKLYNLFFINKRKEYNNQST